MKFSITGRGVSSLEALHELSFHLRRLRNHAKAIVKEKQIVEINPNAKNIETFDRMFYLYR
jgi:hypothetical protein